MISTKASAMNLRHQCFLKFDKNNLLRSGLKFAEVCYQGAYFLYRSTCQLPLVPDAEDCFQALRHEEYIHPRSRELELIEDCEMRELAAYFNRGRFPFTSCKNATTSRLWSRVKNWSIILLLVMVRIVKFPAGNVKLKDGAVFTTIIFSSFLLPCWEVMNDSFSTNNLDIITDPITLFQD